jgi:hypothetical protein
LHVLLSTAKRGYRMEDVDACSPIIDDFFIGSGEGNHKCDPRMAHGK